MKLVIADRRPPIYQVWTEVFLDVSSVLVMQADVRMLMSMPGIDCILMLGMVAHERHGGTPRNMQSQILSTRGEAGMPPWVITLPSRVVPLTDTLTTGSPMAARHRSAEDQEWAFATVFDCVIRFNEGGDRPKISSLGVELDFINLPLGDPRKEAQAVRGAFMVNFSGERN